MPRGELRQIDLEITYGVVAASVFSRLLTNIFFALQQGKKVDINLEIVDHSPWCTANLKSGTVTTTISTQERELFTVLTIRVDEDAPAYDGGFVKIDVSTDDIKGPFGISTRIKGYEEQFTINFVPGYLPLISIELPEGSTFKIPPHNETTIPINIQNLGNARTRVSVELVDVPGDLTATIEEDITLDMDESGQIYLVTKINNDFDKGTLKLNFIPSRTEDLTDMGESSYITMAFENDGSYIEENDSFEMNVALLGIIVFILLLAIVIVFFLKRKKP